MTDENGDTRRQRNDRVGVPSPPLVIPEHGRYFIEWFDELSDGCIRIIDGVCHPIPWSEYHAWQTMTGHVVYPFEYVILQHMDRVYCAVLNEEFEAFRIRQREKKT